MSLILASLYSVKSISSGLMIYDTNSFGHRYIQLLDCSGLPLRKNQIRGVSINGDRLYALVPCAMLIFRITNRNDAPIFKLEKTVHLPEWILGDSQQGNLHAVYASDEQKRVFISFNNQCAIDVFDLDGNFIERRFLWDIAPDLFFPPKGRISKGYIFGVVRHIFETKHKELLISIALINGKKESAVISLNNGRKIISWESEPLHGGLIDKNILYVCAIQKGEVQSFLWPEKQAIPDNKPLIRFSPQIADKKFQKSEQKTRGLLIKNNRLFCGVCYFGKPKAHQIAPRLVEFNLLNGEQIREHKLPSFQGFEEPHIYSLLSIDRVLGREFTLYNEDMYYIGEKLKKAVYVPCELSVKKTDTELKNFESLNKEIRKNNEVNTKNENIKKETKYNMGFNLQLKEKNQDKKNKLESEIIKSKTSNVHLNAIKNTNISSNIYKPTVIFENVGLCFERSARKLISFNKNLRSKKKFWALRDISFTVNEGETLGVIGRNGSGKSTLSMICSGVLVPDKGKVKVYGKIQLLALGVGFKNELSGRENVYICGSLLGLSKNRIKEHMEDIEEFAELGAFIDEPVRTYSSGMRSRLGFAVATVVKPDILVLDEIMATGDKAFQDKAMKRMREMHSIARSVIVVSHNPVQLRKLSTKVLWLEKGRMFMFGEPKEILNVYDTFCKNPNKWFRNNPDMAEKINSDEQEND